MPAMSRLESAFCRHRLWRASTRRLVLPWALQQTQLTGEVLEIGAGSGSMAGELLATQPRVRMTVTDIDPEMVAAASQVLNGFGDRVSVVRADASALAFPTASFDAVLSLLMLHHIGRWEEALADATRVLSPGGLLLSYDLLSRWPNRLVHRLDGSPHRLLQFSELEEVLGQLPLTDVRLDVRLAGLVVRFQGRKSTEGREDRPALRCA